MRTPPPLTKPGTRKLSDVARHVIVPSGIVSTGYPSVQAKCRDLGIEHDDWQQGLGRLILGKRSSGKYAATVGGIVMSIPRQVGKTFTVGSIIFALCLLFPRLTVLWTAHHTRTSNETFRSLQGLAARSKVKPFVAAVRQVNGEQEIRFTNGSRIMFGAREQGFGRGFAEVDIEVFDEAQILSERALEDMVAATNQAKHPAGALLFYMGTPPRAVDNGEAFSAKRTRALDGKSTDMVYVELSADEDADPDDRDQVLKANPSVPLRTPWESVDRLRENVGSDESYLREGLGVWQADVSKHVIDSRSWAAVTDELSVGSDRFAVAVSVRPDRSVSSIAGAALRADGRWHVELQETRSGVSWVVPYLEAFVKANPQVRALAVNAGSQAATLLDDFTARGLRPTEMNGMDVGSACGAFFDGVFEARLVHIGQPQLTYALSVAGKRPLYGGKLWAWAPKTSEDDITALEACTWALWGAQHEDVNRPARRSGGRRVVVPV